MDGGLVAAKCTAPARNVDAITAADVSLWYKDNEIQFVGGSPTVQLLPAVVYEIAPEAGSLAAGTAARQHHI